MKSDPNFSAASRASELEKLVGRRVNPGVSLAEQQERFPFLKNAPVEHEYAADVKVIYVFMKCVLVPRQLWVVDINEKYAADVKVIHVFMKCVLYSVNYGMRISMEIYSSPSKVTRALSSPLLKASVTQHGVLSTRMCKSRRAYSSGFSQIKMADIRTVEAGNRSLSWIQNYSLCFDLWFSPCHTPCRLPYPLIASPASTRHIIPPFFLEMH